MALPKIGGASWAPLLEKEDLQPRSFLLKLCLTWVSLGGCISFMELGTCLWYSAVAWNLALAYGTQQSLIEFIHMKGGLLA